MTWVAAPRASSTAPVPRPPQPITPILIGMSASARAPDTNGNSANAAPAKAADDPRRKWRREHFDSVAGEVGSEVFMREIVEEGLGEKPEETPPARLSQWIWRSSGENRVCAP